MAQNRKQHYVGKGDPYFFAAIALDLVFSSGWCTNLFLNPAQNIFSFPHRRRNKTDIADTHLILTAQGEGEEGEGAFEDDAVIPGN